MYHPFAFQNEEAVTEALRARFGYWFVGVAA
jgi:hypothetical protein